jgi:hypothetical protein
MSLSTSNKDLFDTIIIVAYFKFVNRMVLEQEVAYDSGELSGFKDEPNDN